jgi:eukaryotic-like serine/threonine-protein kinase
VRTTGSPLASPESEVHSRQGRAPHRKWLLTVALMRTAVLQGSVTRLGKRYVLGLRATDCRSGKLLAEQQFEASGKDDVLSALTKMSAKFRTEVGESLATVEKHNTPLAEATTPSLEALKSYSTGLNVSSSMGEAAALPFFKHAVEIDPKFAAAYAELGLMYGAIGESAFSMESTSRANKLKDRVSDPEKFFIAASYDSRVTGNFQAERTCETWAQAYPREHSPHAYLSGFILPASGRYEGSVVEAKKLLELDPHSAIGYIMLTVAYTALDRYSDAETVIRQASDRGLNTPEIIGQRYDLAFLRGHASEMEQLVALSRRDTDSETWLLDRQAFALGYTGHLLQARATSRRATDSAEQAAHWERAALSEAGTAVREAFSGNAFEAKNRANAALELSHQREVEYGVAFALALSGEYARSQRLTDDLANRFPEDTSVKFNYVPTLRALLALKHGSPSQAIELLQISVPYELGTQRSTIHGSFGALYPIYVRGEAQLAAGRGTEASDEFEKILNHRGIVLTDPVGVSAYLGLARAYAISGDTMKARHAYDEFLALWKDADPGITVLTQAKTEYAALR